jgi:hypothetical protein
MGQRGSYGFFGLDLWRFRFDTQHPHKTMTKIFIPLLVGCILEQTVSAQWPLTDAQRREVAELEKETNMPPQMREQYTMIVSLNYKNFAYRAAVAQKMLEEANYFADRLQLPTKRPIQATDIQRPLIFDPWHSVIRDEQTMPNEIVSGYGTNIFNPNIPREARLRALEFGTFGTIENTNFFFSFRNGKLWEVERLSEHGVEHYANNLDKLIGKSSLIDTNGAYQLATQWLAAVDVDVAALEKTSGPLTKGGHSINQLHYQGREATNAVALPLYYVDFGLRHYPAAGPNLKDFDEPLVSVEILGMTKELQDLRINDLSFSHRPLLLITNALDLIRTTNLPVKQLTNSLPDIQTNSASP